MRTQPREKLKPDQVATMLGLRKEYILELARRGQIPHVRIGRYCRFDEADIERWWNARKVGDERSTGGGRAA